ncbi:hypothetical protein WN55_01032 [Dufourea novaeangliae]|uniref:Uncharacterized protein n=1 Tax=Dufourea novaeangliae TaxID=178035 RepID=A0A154PDM3_DUFNO|nr:hypothetical protein WN55_01032 [Dufourea novaeangliae]
MLCLDERHLRDKTTTAKSTGAVERVLTSRGNAFESTTEHGLTERRRREATAKADMHIHHRLWSLLVMGDIYRQLYISIFSCQYN